MIISTKPGQLLVLNKNDSVVCLIIEITKLRTVPNVIRFINSSDAVKQCRGADGGHCKSGAKF